MEFCPTPRLPFCYQNSSKIAMFRHRLNYKSLFFSQNSRKTAMLLKKISFSSSFCFFSYAQWWSSPIPLPFFCPPHSPKGGVWLAPLCEPFESLCFKGKIVSVGKSTPLCLRCSSRGGGGVPPFPDSLAPWWVFAQWDTRKRECPKVQKGVSRLLFPY